MLDIVVLGILVNQVFKATPAKTIYEGIGGDDNDGDGDGDVDIAVMVNSDDGNSTDEVNTSVEPPLTRQPVARSSPVVSNSNSSPSTTQAASPIASSMDSRHKRSDSYMAPINTYNKWRVMSGFFSKAF